MMRPPVVRIGELTIDLVRRFSVVPEINDYPLIVRKAELNHLTSVCIAITTSSVTNCCSSVTICCSEGLAFLGMV